MPQSLSAVALHAVFSTKDRSPYLLDSGLRSEVQAYIGGISTRQGCPVVAIGGVADHVHVLAYFSRTITIADWLREIKRSSSVFAREKQPGFAWQAGYGVFCVEPASIDRIARYVRDQEKHHHAASFQDELRILMSEHGIEIDERYIWE